MIKLFFHFLILLFLTNCSVGEKSGIFMNKEKNKSTKNISDIEFNYDLSFDRFKKNVIEYGKFSDYPKLDK